MTPKQFVKETKKLIESIEIVINVYETSTTKVERIHKLIQDFKEVIRNGISKTKNKPGKDYLEG